MKKFLIAFLLVCLGVKPMYAAGIERGLSLSCKKYYPCSLICSEGEKCEMTAAEKSELNKVFEDNIKQVGFRRAAMSRFVSLYSQGFSDDSFMKVCDIAFADLLQQNRRDEMVNKCSTFYTELLKVYFEAGKPCTNNGGVGVYVIADGQMKCKLRYCKAKAIGMEVTKDGFNCMSKHIHSADNFRSEADKETRQTNTKEFLANTRSRFENSPYLYYKYDGNVTAYEKEIKQQIEDYVNGVIDEDPTDMSKVKKLDDEFFEEVCRQYGGYVEYSPEFSAMQESGNFIYRPRPGSGVLCETKYIWMMDLSTVDADYKCKPLQNRYGTLYVCEQIDEKSLSGDDKLALEQRKREEAQRAKLCKGYGSVEVLNTVAAISKDLQNKSNQNNSLSIYYDYEECFNSYGYFLKQAGDGSFYIEQSGK